MSRLLRQLGWLFRRGRREADLQDEIAFHLSAEAEDRQAGGLSLQDASFVARRDLGSVARVQENTRAAWGWIALEHFLQDLRYALRGLRKNPGFTAAAVVSLALGIGANTAIFSLIDALLLRWLPVRDPQQLVQVKFQLPGEKGPSDGFSYPIVRALAEQKDALSGAGGFSGWTFNVGAAGSTERVSGALVTGGFYETLGLAPAAGRLLTSEDDQPGAPLVAVISYGYWERQFSRHPEAIGAAIRINRVPVTIAGVSPRGFVGANVGSIADITMAVAALPVVSPESALLAGQGNFWLRVLARPAPGVSIPQAKARLAAVWPHIWDRVIRPDWPLARRQAFSRMSFDLSPGGTGWTTLRDRFREPLLILLGVVALVLLIACANVANLLLARGSARSREMQIRLAIGAGRGRIIRQLLTESAVLSASGAALGVGLAWIAGRLLLGVLSSGPRTVIFDLTPNAHVLAFTCAVAMVTSILFGLAPALQNTATRKLTAPGAHSRLLSSLAAVQVALSLVLVYGAGLFVRTLQNLENLDPGFRRGGVLVVEMESRRTAFPRELLSRLEQIPGVAAVSVSTHTPLDGATWSEPAVPRGQPVPEGDNAVFVGAGPRFFETLGTPLLAGRKFAGHDSAAAPGVAVINESYARRYFPNANPVGRHLSAMVRRQPSDLEIVGLVRNSNLSGLRRAAPPTVYVPYYQLTGDFPTTLEVRAAGSLSQVAAAIRKTLQPEMPDAPLEIHSLSAQVDATLVQERLLATLASAFGGLALALACVGLYGLLAYSVARQRREIGIRMALGARRGSVIGGVLRRALALVLAGAALGLPAALAASRWVKSMLFGLTPLDLSAILGSTALLAAAAVAASYLPARRAANVDPITALRHE